MHRTLAYIVGRTLRFDSQIDKMLTSELCPDVSTVNAP